MNGSYRDIDDRTEELSDLAQAHPDIWDDFLSNYELSWIYHENAIEGIVLTHAELTSALTGRPISPETYGDIRNLRIASNLIRRKAPEGEPIHIQLVDQIQSILGAHDTKFAPSQLRQEIPLHRAYFHEIVQPEVIQKKLNHLMHWAKEHDPGEDDNAVRFAAKFHHEYMRIFPYAMHTGKTGRLLVNYILVRHGYLPVVFHSTERQRYYDCLRLKPSDVERLINDSMVNCIDNGINYVESILEQRKKRQRHLRAV